jgi:transcriptional repressor NrdR
VRCPVCDRDETQIVATRESDESDVIRRCLKYEKRFTTDERSKIGLPAVAGPR